MRLLTLQSPCPETLRAYLPINGPRQPAGGMVLAQDLHSPAAVPLASKKKLVPATSRLGHIAGVRTGCLKAPAGRPLHSNHLIARATSVVSLNFVLSSGKRCLCCVEPEVLLMRHQPSSQQLEFI